MFLYTQSITVNFFQSKKKIGCVEFFNFQLIEVHCKIEGCILLPLRKEESKHLWILKPNSPLKYQKFYQILEILWMGRWKNIYIMFHGWKNIYLPFWLELPYYISAFCAGQNKNIHFFICLVCWINKKKIYLPCRLDLPERKHGNKWALWLLLLLLLRRTSGHSSFLENE